jgi:CRISPR-associated protein Csb3
MSIQVNVDPTNPGEFFACCGLLELADRLHPGAEGFFRGDTFQLETQASMSSLMDQLVNCELTNTMTSCQWTRLQGLTRMKKNERGKTPGLEEEKKELEKLRRESPIVLGAPLGLRIDWFTDDQAGGSRFKTWAGQQSVFDITTKMKDALTNSVWRTTDPQEWLNCSICDCGLPFNFDSNLGGQGSALDVGFSFDPLAASDATRIAPTARPLLELLGFIALQRFRPQQIQNENRYAYSLWTVPFLPETACAAACGVLPTPNNRSFEFRLLYRTQYLKSFLPAIPTGGSNE